MGCVNVPLEAYKTSHLIWQTRFIWLHLSWVCRGWSQPKLWKHMKVLKVTEVKWCESSQRVLQCMVASIAACIVH